MINEQGKFATATLLDVAVLSDDFADNVSDKIQCSPLAQLELIIAYTENVAEANNSALVRLLLSEDGENFSPYSIASDETPVGGVVKSTLYERQFVVPGTPDEEVRRWFAIPTGAKYFKVEAMESGLADLSKGGTLTVKARLTDAVTALVK